MRRLRWTLSWELAVSLILLAGCGGDRPVEPDAADTSRPEPAKTEPRTDPPERQTTVRGVTIEPYTGPLRPGPAQTPSTPTDPPGPKPHRPTMSPNGTPAPQSQPIEPGVDHAPPRAPTELALPDADHTVTVEVGQKVRIRVEGNPTTGYRWGVERIIGQAVMQRGNIEYEPASAQIIGAGGEFIVPFRAVRPGSATVVLSYRRPWEKNKPPERTFTVHLDVQPARPLAGQRGLAARSDLARRIAEALPEGWTVMSAGPLSAPPGWTGKAKGEWLQFQHAWLRYRYDDALPARMTLYLMPRSYVGMLRPDARNETTSAYLFGQNRTTRLFLRGMLPPEDDFRTVERILRGRFGFRSPASVAPQTD
jgi:inhibitor of cysteine peptidase